jgi:hypothetical protein
MVAAVPDLAPTPRSYPHSLLRTLQQHAFYLRLGEHPRDRVWCGLCLTPRMIARVVYYAVALRIWRPD